MDIIQWRVAGAGGGFLFIFLSGFCLKHSGKLYPCFKFNLHQWIGLAAGGCPFLLVRA